MAELVKEPKAKPKRMASDAIEELFMLDKPEKVKGRDGKTYELFHRYGPSNGAYTKDDLMELVGFKSELKKVEKDANKRYKSISEAREVVDSREGMLKRKLHSRIMSCKGKLMREYQEIGLIPLMAFVRIHSETEDRKFFIEGFCNLDGEFVIGNRDDAALWAIEVMSGARGMAQKYRLAHAVGKDLVNKGLLSGPIKERLALTLKA
jgi:hypothetical protein